MFNAFIEVIVELWSFIFANDKEVRLALPGQVEAQTFKSQVANKEFVKGVNFTTGTIVESIGRLAYVGADEAVCYSQAIIDFDTKLGDLHYGDAVMVKSINGAYAKINFQDYDGWMKVSDLVDDKNLIFPNLMSAYVYGPKNDETLKLRKYLKDELLGGLLNLPLQPLELIIFLLKTQRIVVKWPNTKPRIPGSLNNLLKGKKGVSMSIEPRTSSIIEYLNENNDGIIGFITEVSPDLAITMSSVGRIEAGEYRVEKFTHDEWKEWRPVFISFI